SIPVALVNWKLLLQSFSKVYHTFSTMSTQPGVTEDLAAASFTLGWTLFRKELVGGFLLLVLGQIFRGRLRLLARSLGGGLLLGIVLTGALFLLVIWGWFAMN